MDRTDGKLKNGDSRTKSQIPLPETSQYLWKLNEFELKVAYAILEKHPKTTWEHIAKSLGISRRALYSWRQSEKIREPIRKIARDLLLSELSGVYEALVRKAKSGDCSAMRLYFDVVRDIEEQKQRDSAFCRGGNSLRELLDSIPERKLAAKEEPLKISNSSKVDENRK